MDEMRCLGRVVGSILFAAVISLLLPCFFVELFDGATERKVQFVLSFFPIDQGGGDTFSS